MHVYTHVHVGMSVKQVRGQSEKVGQFLAQCRFQRSNMGCRVWKQLPLPTQPPPCPYKNFKIYIQISNIRLVLPIESGTYLALNRYSLNVDINE